MKIKPLILLFAIASLLLGCSEKEQPAKTAVQEQPVETQPPAAPAPKKEPPLTEDSTDDSPEKIEQEVQELVDTLMNETDMNMPREELEQEIRKMVDEMEPQKTD